MDLDSGNFGWRTELGIHARLLPRTCPRQRVQAEFRQAGRGWTSSNNPGNTMLGNGRNALPGTYGAVTHYLLCVFSGAERGSIPERPEHPANVSRLSRWHSSSKSPISEETGLDGRGHNTINFFRTESFCAMHFRTASYLPRISELVTRNSHLL